MANFKKNQGFTIVELLLYVAVSSVILLVTSLFLSSLLESRIKNQTIAEVEQQGIQVMQLITQALRNADSINLPAQGASGSTLSINTILAGSNPTVFNLNNGAIQLKEGLGDAILLVNSKIVASNLIFYNLSKANTPGTVRILFTLTAVNNSGRKEYSFSKDFIGSGSLRQP